MRRRRPLLYHLISHTKKTDHCWLWTGRVDGVGYGVIQVGRKAKRIGAHRASWIEHYGDIPNGLFVCHHCDVRNCVRPDHLFLGTQTDNLRDASAKGRLNVSAKAWRAERTHCPRGHPFDSVNTKLHGRTRLCRKCRAENQRAYKRRHAQTTHSRRT